MVRYQIQTPKYKNYHIVTYNNGHLNKINFQYLIQQLLNIHKFAQQTIFKQTTNHEITIYAKFLYYNHLPLQISNLVLTSNFNLNAINVHRTISYTRYMQRKRLTIANNVLKQQRNLVHIKKDNTITIQLAQFQIQFKQGQKCYLSTQHYAIYDIYVEKKLERSIQCNTITQKHVQKKPRNLYCNHVTDSILNSIVTSNLNFNAIKIHRTIPYFSYI
eukprot:TRINITY_DN6843_c0_g1_i4.p1 TRINITY_DN6843_c0_g1~~TRINITY_DN6843_c0_g1_i4.p1  ORF type:complete len:237 (-),score=-31.75 TRINITY_DN6843_c0_g1_i4:386-1036(-)